MHYDWLTIHQDHDFQLPILAETHFRAVTTSTGELGAVRQPLIEHGGSYSTNINIKISGNRIQVSGNPSRVNRLDNLFGFSSIDQCVSVYNDILKIYGLPPFTKCTKVWHLAGQGSRINTFTDGAVFEEIHITTNQTTGSMVRENFDNQLNLFSNIESFADTFIKAVSTLPYRHSVPHLFPNGKTCDWRSKSGGATGLIYASIYNKAHDLETKTLPQIKRKFGEDSPEHQYILDLIEYCKINGVVRFEQKLKSAFLRDKNYRFYGLSNLDPLRSLQDEFLKVPSKLQVEHMSLESITEKLISNGICEHTKAANATTIYAIQWMHGHKFDLNKSQVKTHRARLRKIGIDIAVPCDLNKFSLVTVREATQITVGQLIVPEWYKKPVINHLQLAG